MTTPTQLPVPSKDPRDLLFNAEKMDEAISSFGLTYLDRFGVEHSTLAGAVATIAATNTRGPWAAATAYAVKDVVTSGGIAYICVQSHTSGATFAGDSAFWRVFQGVLASDLADDTDLTKGAGLSGYADGVPYPLSRVGGQINILKYSHVDLIGKIPRSEWAAIANGTSAYDVGPIVKALWVEKPGRPIRLPSGQIRLDTMADYIGNSGATFSEGPKLHGPGSDVCVVESRVANNPALKFDTNAVGVGRFLRNIEMCGFSLTGEFGNPANASGLSLRHAYNTLCDDLFIRNFTLDGFYVMLNEGDPDGCNNLLLDRSRAANCGRWCFNNESLGGHNEFSFLIMRGGSSFTNGGTASAWDPSTGAAPTGGGLRWKGNGAKLTDGYISETNGPAVWLEGNAGLPVQFATRDFTFENCGGSTTAAAFYSSGIGGLDLDNIDLRNNDTYRARYGVFLESTGFATLGVRIRGVKAQITTGNNPHTMFEARGANGVDLGISDTTWRAYDGTGQTRFGAGLYSTFKSSLTIEDNNRFNYKGVNVLETTLTTASPTYTIDFARYTQHVVILGAAMTGTLDFPSPNYMGLAVAVRAGREVVITIINNTGGVRSITFSGISTRNPPASVAAPVGSATTGRFIYVAGVGLVQNGPWG